jgi:hypothetical protein
VVIVGIKKLRESEWGYQKRPNVVVEWLTLLLHIRDVLDSNLCPENG